ncbi:hypothetical protein K439DRAFT_1619065 [Ramaria rubella]|nr:hypothetical protein K439DRAFT_1619065 [Ramaria rubella]
MPLPPDIDTLVLPDSQSPCRLHGKLTCSVSSGSSNHTTSSNPHHPSQTGSLLPAGVWKRGRPSVVSLLSSNIAPPPSPGRSSEPPRPDCDSLLASGSDYVPDYSLETALHELIIIRCEAHQLEDRLNIKCQHRFLLEDCQMQDRLTRCEREDEVLLEAIDVAANILAAQS